MATFARERMSGRSVELKLPRPIVGRRGPGREAAGSWDPDCLKISAAGGKLNGTKLFVTDAAIADFIVVVARDGVFVVEAKAPGQSLYQ